MLDIPELAFISELLIVSYTGYIAPLSLIVIIALPKVGTDTIPFSPNTSSTNF
jgi:hypothetical protein